MIRPCFLVVDREFPGTISTRKLVIETAKINVITAYSGAEAIETLQRFPAVNGIVMDAGVSDIHLDDLIRQLKKLDKSLPIVVIETPGFQSSGEADHHLEFFDPIRLLTLLRKLVPEQTAEIDAHEDDLSRDRSTS
ncbi:MAG TPA: response regulator [Acidisarcina sp.]